MNENRLRKLLREEPVPATTDAERRGLALIARAYAERQPERRPVLPRLALAFAVVTLLAAAVLSPAGAAVRSWIDDVFTAGVRHAEPALTELPGGGSLLVQSPSGPWVVHPDGSRRLLGDYAEAGWSPHGLFVATTSRRTLSAIEPSGTPHWSISANGRAEDPSWSPSGLRIAYRAGHSLLVVRADATAKRLVDSSVAAIAAAWLPLGPHLLAYVDASRRLRIAEADTAATVASAAAMPGISGLSWAPDGGELLEIARHRLRLRDVHADKLADSLDLGPARELRLPHGARVRAAAFSPRADRIATLLELSTRAGESRSEVLLIDPAGGPTRRLFAVSGRLSQLAWSPDGNRLLLTWPAADQWLFVPTQSGGRLRAVGDISAVFSPGHRGRAPFPQIEGWCCAPAPGGSG